MGNEDVQIRQQKKFGAFVLSGFTVIELLVVISILSILLAVMVPSLRLAKEQAVSVMCKNNLKSIGVTINLYTNDHKQRLAPYWDGLFYVEDESYTSPLDDNTYDAFGRFYLYTSWMSGSTDFYHEGLRDNDGYLREYLGHEIMGHEDVLGCPAVDEGPVITDQDALEEGYYLVYRGMTYLLNVEAFSSDQIDPYRITTIRNPGQLVFMCEGRGTGSAVNQPGDEWEGGETPKPRHNNKFNALFLDAHVESGTRESLYTKQYFIRQ
jgi:prepilin-type processing-associated H-X9-DG protein/prepilin-type N-terminal cleavage/methylation domain-containing protein